MSFDQKHYNVFSYLRKENLAFPLCIHPDSNICSCVVDSKNVSSVAERKYIIAFSVLRQAGCCSRKTQMRNLCDITLAKGLKNKKAEQWPYTLGSKLGQNGRYGGPSAVLRDLATSSCGTRFVGSLLLFLVLPLLRLPLGSQMLFHSDDIAEVSTRKLRQRRLPKQIVKA